MITRRWFLTTLAALGVAGRPVFAVAPRYSEAEREFIAWAESHIGRTLSREERWLWLKQARAIHGEVAVSCWPNLLPLPASLPVHLRSSS